MAQGWHEENANISIVENGYTYYFNAETSCYPAFAYPASLGELKHIYQNNLYEFDLLSSFEKSTIVQNGKTYLLYKFPEENLLDNDKFEFLWKDRK